MRSPSLIAEICRHIAEPAMHACRSQDDLHVWETNLDINYGLLKIAPAVALVAPRTILQLFGPAAVTAPIGAQL